MGTCQDDAEGVVRPAQAAGNLLLRPVPQIDEPVSAIDQAVEAGIVECGIGLDVYPPGQCLCGQVGQKRLVQLDSADEGHGPRVEAEDACRSEGHRSELQSRMRTSYSLF